jgi:hypothetical protein
MHCPKMSSVSWSLRSVLITEERNKLGVLVEAFLGDKRLKYSEVFCTGEIECTKEMSDILSESSRKC